METIPIRCNMIGKVLSCRIAKCTNVITPIAEYECTAKGCRRISPTGKPIGEFYPNAFTKFMSEYPPQLADQLSCLLQLDRLLSNTGRIMGNILLRDCNTVIADGFDTAFSCAELPVLDSFNSNFTLKATNDIVLVSDLPADSSLKRMCDIAQMQFTHYLGKPLIFI